MVINVEIILWRYKHVYVMWAGCGVERGRSPSLSIFVLPQKQRHPPTIPPLPRIQIWPSATGALGLWGRGCHYCIMPSGAQHPHYATVGLHHSLYPSSFCCTTMVPNYYCIPNFKVPYCSPNLDSVCFAWFLITVCWKVGSSRYRRLFRSLSGISWAGDSPHHLFKMPTVSCIVCLASVKQKKIELYTFGPHMMPQTCFRVPMGMDTQCLFKTWL